MLLKCILVLSTILVTVYSSCSSSAWFQCKQEGTCIPASRVCDGDEQCMDGSDELNCGKSNGRTIHYFCKSPTKINSLILTECKENEFKCVSSGRCIWDQWLCDGHDACEDGSDEHPDICGTFLTLSTALYSK